MGSSQAAGAFRSRPLSRDQRSRDAFKIASRLVFRPGRVYLSGTSRNAYFGLQRSLGVLAASDNWSNESLNNLDPDTFEHLRLIASRLRTMLTLDVGTRNPFTFDADAPRVDAGKPMRPDPKDVDEQWIARNWGSYAKQHDHADGVDGHRGRRGSESQA